MARVLVYYAHPGQRFSRANAALADRARQVDGISFVDLYAEYPRFHIDIDAEQTRLREHDIIVMQYPLFWYSCPSLLKEWMDLVLEHGFAYGHEGDALRGKTLALSITAAGSEEAYTPQGYQNHDIRTFLTPMEQTATLCQMTFLAPYVLYGSLRATEDDLARHAHGYAQYLEGLRDDRLAVDRAIQADVIGPDNLPLRAEVA